MVMVNYIIRCVRSVEPTIQVAYSFGCCFASGIMVVVVVVGTGASCAVHMMMIFLVLDYSLLVYIKRVIDSQMYAIESYW